jgi:rhodanese-related sulfurtransferase
LKLKEMGFREVYALAGGWKAWAEADYPTEPIRDRVAVD